MAIAFDAAAQGSSTVTTVTFAQTCTGSNLVLFVEAYSTTGDDVTGITYNSVAMTQLAKISKNGSAEKLYLYYLIAPATGSNNVVVTRSGTGGFLHGAAASFTGALQSGIPDSTNQAAQTVAATSQIIATTTVLDNCWLVGAWVCDNGGISGQSGTVVRAGDTTFDVLASGEAAVTPAGSASLAVNCNNTKSAGIVASFAPVLDTANHSSLLLMGVG